MLNKIKFHITLLFIGIFSQIGHSQHPESIFGISKILILDDTTFVYNNTQRISNDLAFVQKAEMYSGVGVPPLISHSENYTKFEDQLRFPMNFTNFGRNIFSVHANSQYLVPGVIEWDLRVSSFNMDSRLFLHSGKKGYFPSFRLHLHSPLPFDHPLKVSNNQPYYDLVVLDGRYLLIISTGQEVFVLESQDPCNPDCEKKPLFEEPKPCVDEWYFINHFKMEGTSNNEASNKHGYFRVYIDSFNQIVLAYNNGQSYAMDLRKNSLMELDLPSVKDKTLVYDSRTDKYYWIPKLHKVDELPPPNSISGFLESIGKQ